MPSARLTLPPLTISGLPARIACSRRPARMSGCRVVKQPLLRIGDAIADGEIEGAPALRGLIERCGRRKKDAISWD